MSCFPDGYLKPKAKCMKYSTRLIIDSEKKSKIFVATSDQNILKLALWFGNVLYLFFAYLYEE